MMGEPKKYGLIIPTKKSTNKPVKKLAVFGDDSSDDEDAAHKEVNLSLLQESQKKKQMKQTQIEIQKALEQDPSVYEYDAIYDQMEEKKKAANAKVPEQDRKPKYIENLLKSAAARKRDFERTIERQMQKEREQEDGEYEDKEAFVTEAFRKKMQEQAEEEERIKRQDAIDAANDVTKQKDLSLFYRNLLNQNVSLGGSFAADDKTNSKSIENEDLKNKPSELLGKADDKDNAKESENREQTEERNPSNRSVEKQRKEKDNKSPKAKEKSSRRNDEQERESRRHAKSPDRHRRHHEHSSRRRSYSDSDEDRKGHSKNSHRRDRKRQSRSDEGESRHRQSERRRTSHDDRKHSDRSEPKRTSHYDQKDNERKRDHHGERNREEKNVRVTDQQDPQTVGQETRESIDTLSEVSKSKFAKRSTDETVMSAKERYLARKMAREAAATPADNDGSDED